MERNDLSSRLVMKDDLSALTKIVIGLAKSIADCVYEMGEHDEDAYDSSGKNFEEDVDYTARREDCHYIPTLEDEIANYYYLPPLQNQQGRQDDEEQEEPSLAKVMAQMIATQTQMIATQAQQGKDLQLLTSELHQGRAARKILEAQFAQQTSSSSQNPEKFPLQPDDEQLEQVKEEVVEQETPCVVPPAFVPPIPFPHRQIKVHVETIDGDKVIDVCQLTFFESKVLSNKHAKNSDTARDNLNDAMKKSFHKGPEILICNTRLKDETTMSLPGH